MINESRFSRRAAADKVLLTVSVSDIDRWDEELRALRRQRDEALRSYDDKIALLENKLNLARILIDERAANPRPVDEEERPAELPLEPLPSQFPQMEVRPRGRSGPKRSPAFVALKAIMLDLAKRPEGFEPKEAWDLFKADQNIPEKVRAVPDNYIYRVAKDLRYDGILEKMGEKYVAGPDFSKGFESSEPEGVAAPVQVPDGYKLVAKTKEERVREEAARYLGFRKGRTAHRAAIADHLTSIGVMGTEKSSIRSLSVYLSKWPEFRAEGDGIYTLVTGDKNTGDGS
jgi:hypothetical protein